MADRLDPIFRPASIAIIGASRHRGKVGWAILRNLIVNEYQGVIYPVNPHASSVHSIKAYPTVLDVPGPVDLAIVTVPADRVLMVMEQCAEKGVRGAIVITAGFREVGGKGVERERALLELCRTHGITLVGPNCMGVINTDPKVQLDATFAPTPPLRGNISFLSQSGALGVAILDHAKNLNLGFAKFVSLGNKADVSGNDLLTSWERDPDTKLILMYLENFGNPRNFVRIARPLSKKKPILALKSGRTEAGGRATVSHTGGLGGSDIAADAVFEQTGVIRANSIEELFDFAMAFSLQKPPRGKRVAVVTDAGGPAVMATDTLIGVGLELASFEAGTKEALRAIAPEEASVENPVDLIADADAPRYEKALDIVLRDPNVDAAIVIYVPPIVTEEVRVAQAIWRTAAKHDKSVLANLVGRSEESAGFVELVRHGIPSYLFPESAARALAAMHQYKAYVDRDEGTFPTFDDVDREGAKAILAAAERDGVSRLREVETLELLKAYGFHVVETRTARDGAEAQAAAREIGFPVVLKAMGPTLVHKTELKAVAVDLRDADELGAEFARMEARLRRGKVEVDGWLVQEYVKGGIETILGMSLDRTFGPLLAFGLGGIYVEYLKDVAFALAPLTDQDARRTIRRIRSYPILEGVRGEAPRDVDALAEAMERLSQLVTDFEEIAEIDMNPLIVLEKGKGYKVVDARVVLGG
jgi:acetyltransferase